jgi:hypothetical protein
VKSCLRSVKLLLYKNNRVCSGDLGLSRTASRGAKRLSAEDNQRLCGRKLRRLDGGLFAPDDDAAFEDAARTLASWLARFPPERRGEACLVLTGAADLFAEGDVMRCLPPASKAGT